MKQNSVTLQTCPPGIYWEGVSLADLYARRVVKVNQQLWMHNWSFSARSSLLGNILVYLCGPILIPCYWDFTSKSSISFQLLFLSLIFQFFFTTQISNYPKIACHCHGALPPGVISAKKVQQNYTLQKEKDLDIYLQSLTVNLSAAINLTSENKCLYKLIPLANTSFKASTVVLRLVHSINITSYFD